MATEEERQKILAEYYATAGADDEEEDFESEASLEEEGGFAGDSDDDDDDAEYEENTAITLSGRLSCLSNSKVMYKGIWGVKNKFKLRAPAPISVSEKAAVDDFLRDPDSVLAGKVMKFDGYFETDDGQRIEEKAVEIFFKKDSKVTGKGSNQYGSFQLRGEYDGNTHNLKIQKSYGDDNKRKKVDENDDRKIAAKKSKIVESEEECEF